MADQTLSTCAASLRSVNGHSKGVTVDLDLDIQSHDLYLDGPPFERFDRLRREMPVFRHEDRNPDEIDWFWAITRYDDIVTVSRQWDDVLVGARV